MRLARFGALLATSIALAAVLEAAGAPAGLLLGPMAAAIVFAARGGRLDIPPFLFLAAQALIGLMIAPSLSPTALATVAREPGQFAGVTLATLLVSVLTGWLLTRWRVLPGAVAVWGLMPGAATAMVLMARDEGADWRLVAVASYLRVLCVAVLASLLATAVVGHVGSHPPGQGWFPPPSPRGLVETALIGAAGAWAGLRARAPAGALIGPLVLGAVLEGAGVAHPQLPGWLLAGAYFMIGWRIGLSFTPDIVHAARRAAPGLLLATGATIVFSAGIGFALARWTGRDLMTAYLATSPGGADSVAIIAAAVRVDVPFVMAMQVLRFVVVLLVGPPLARYAAADAVRRAGRSS